MSSKEIIKEIFKLLEKPFLPGGVNKHVTI